MLMAAGRLLVARLGLLALVIWLPLLAGCAGYRLGPSNGMAAGDKSVQIRPFANQTLEPRLTDALTMELRRELQRDGTFQLASSDDADIVVSGVITRYNRRELSLSPTDTLTVRDYRLSLTAQVTARERSTGKVLLRDKPVTGYSLMRVGLDITSAERQAMPLLAGDLAKNITALLSDGSW
jgi:hypothetical protein